MDNIHIYVSEILVFENNLPGVRDGGEFSVSWSYFGYLKSDTQHSKPAGLCAWKTSAQIPSESFQNRNVAGTKTAQ